jgi:hypothetical protein
MFIGLAPEVVAAFSFPDYLDVDVEAKRSILK